jgi:NADPH:quinone reductase
LKAIQIHQFGTPDVMRYETFPTPQPAPGEVLIRVESVSVNYADIMRRSNAVYPFPTPLPFTPGSEVAGTIAALGEGVEGPPIGTPVFGLVGTGSGGYAQFVVTPAAQVIPIPPGVSMDEAAALPVAGTTALLLLRETAGVKTGETVLIPGASGGLGSYAIQLAKLLGAGCVIAATGSRDKFKHASALGADAVVDYSTPTWVDEVREVTGGRGVDVILEMNGGAVFAQSLRALAPFGRLVVYGMSSGQPLEFDPTSILQFFYNPSLNQSIHVFNLGLWFGMRGEAAGKALGDLISYVASGQVKVPVTTLMPLSRAADAHRMIEAREATGKVILKPWLES